MRVPKLPEGLDREIRLLGGAAPLSSRKTGYLLRVAHMIPIIFPALRGRDTAHQGLYSMASLASLDSQMHGNNYILFNENKENKKQKKNKKKKKKKIKKKKKKKIFKVFFLI